MHLSDSFDTAPLGPIVGLLLLNRQSYLNTLGSFSRLSSDYPLIESEYLDYNAYTAFPIYIYISLAGLSPLAEIYYTATVCDLVIVLWHIFIRIGCFLLVHLMLNSCLLRQLWAVL